MLSQPILNKSSLVCLLSFLLGCSATSVINPQNSQSSSLPDKTTEEQVSSLKSHEELTASLAEGEVKFICALGFDKASNQKHPTTYAWTSRGKIAIIRWKKAWYNNSEWTPQRRCEEVSPKFEQAYNNGSLKYLTYGQKNNQTILCTATEDQGDCATQLMTFREEDDPAKIINQLTDVLRGRATAPIPHSSEESQVYYKIDVEQFLETAPIEQP